MTGLPGLLAAVDGVVLARLHAGLAAGHAAALEHGFPGLAAYYTALGTLLDAELVRRRGEAGSPAIAAAGERLVASIVELSDVELLALAAQAVVSAEAFAGMPLAALFADLAAPLVAACRRHLVPRPPDRRRPRRPSRA